MRGNTIQRCNSDIAFRPTHGSSIILNSFREFLRGFDSRKIDHQISSDTSADKRFYYFWPEWDLSQTYRGMITITTFSCAHL